jgi:hypothetical protein
MASILKTSYSPTPSAGFRIDTGAAGARIVAGVVLYDGEIVVAFADDLFAVSFCALWEPGGRAR